MPSGQSEIVESKELNYPGRVIEAMLSQEKTTEHQEKESLLGHKPSAAIYYSAHPRDFAWLSSGHNHLSPHPDHQPPNVDQRYIPREREQREREKKRVE